MSHRLARIVIAMLALAGCHDSSEPARTRPPHKLLVVGWDGATFAMIDPLLASGRLPNVAKMLERGASARLESTRVPISSAAWVGAVTGKNPGQNGVYSFFEPIEGTYDVRLISSRSNKASPIWRILGWHGMKSIVFNVPITYPPEPIDGVLVGCMLSPLESDYAYPKGTAQELRARGFVPDLGAWRDSQKVTFERVEEQLALKREITTEMLREREWDFAMIVFKDLDVWCHKSYDADPSGTVGKHYELLDGVLGQLIEAAGPDTNVVLMSDHGFAAYHRSFFVQQWLVEHGYSTRREGAGEAELDAGDNLAQQNLAQKRALEHQHLIAELDLSHTIAWGGACEGNYGGIRINVKSREQKGCVAPEELDSTLEKMTRQLLATKFPGSEKPLITRVFRGRELYPGAFQSMLPDLIFELDPSVDARTGDAARSYLEHERAYPDHHLYGIFATAGPSFAHRAERGDVSIFDLAPTAMHLLGLPVYSEMCGKVRSELLIDSTPPRMLAERADPAAQRGFRPSDKDFSTEQTREVQSRLRELGYTRQPCSSLR